VGYKYIAVFDGFRGFSCWKNDFARGKNDSSRDEASLLRSKLRQIPEVDLRGIVNDAFVIEDAALAWFDPGRIGSASGIAAAECSRLVRFSEGDVAEEHKRPLPLRSAAVPEIRGVVESLCALHACVDAVAKHPTGTMSRIGRRDNQPVF